MRLRYPSARPAYLLSLLVVILSWFGPAFLLHADPNGTTLKLHIRAKGTGVPVRRVEAKWPDGTKVYSDKEGNLALTVPSGATSFELYRFGYEALTVKLSEVPSSEVYEIFLQPAPPNDSNEVVVRGEKQLEASSKTVSVEEAAKVAPGGDPAQIPKLLPGVQSSTFSPDIVVRGSGPNDSVYLIDDFQVPFIFHLVGNISVVPDQLLSDVTFSSGGFGAQYGNATGGVVGLRTKSEIPERDKTEFRINIPIYSSLYHEQPVNDGKDYFALSARRSYLELFLPAVLKRVGSDNLTVIPSFGDEHAYFVHPTEDGYVKVLGIQAYDGLKLAFDSNLSTGPNGQAQFNLQNSFELLGVEWKKDLSSAWTMKIEPSLSKSDNAINLINNNIDISVLGGMVHADLAYKFNKKDRVYVGGEFGYGQARINVLAPQPNSADPFYDPLSAPQKKVAETVVFTSAVAWSGIDYWLGDLLLSPGVRAFHYSQMKKNGIDPRLNFRYQLDAMNTLKGAVGQYSETPQYQDTDPTFGNPNLNYMHSYQYILGVETNWSDLWLSDVQAFYKVIDDVVETDPVTNRNNNGSAISSGLEVFIRRNLTERLFGWLAYTYSINRAREANNELFHHSQYDETHVLNLAANYKINALWDFGGRGLYHTGDTYTGVGYSVYDVDLDKYEPRQSPNTPTYNDREPPYYEFDLYADRDVLFDTWKLTWRFGIEYLALRPQVQGVNYNYDYTQLNYFRGVPPIPYIELRGIL